MAGQPLKRARNAKAAAAAQAALGVHPSELIAGASSNVRTLSPVADAMRLGNTADNAGAHAPAHARERRALQPGKLQHQAVDELATQQMADFATVLSPECTVRVERLRPPYAAGVCEDVLLDTGELADLIEHVRDEHGGQRYKLTLLSANGTALASSKLNVPGAPRHEGRRVTRAFWSGDDEPRVRNAEPMAPAQSSAANDFAALAEVVRTLATVMAPRDNSTDVIAAVREIAVTTSEQTGRLINALAGNQGEQRPAQSLVTQLNEVIQTQRAIGKLRHALSEGESEPRASSESESGLLSSAVKQAAGAILTQGLQNSMARASAVTTHAQQAAAAQPQPQQPSRGPNVRRVIRRAD